jgi:hypothetical protein
MTVSRGLASAIDCGAQQVAHPCATVITKNKQKKTSFWGVEVKKYVEIFVGINYGGF